MSNPFQEYISNLIAAFLNAEIGVAKFEILKDLSFITHEGDSGEGSSTKYLVEFEDKSGEIVKKVICVSYRCRFLTKEEIDDQLELAKETVRMISEIINYV